MMHKERILHLGKNGGHARTCTRAHTYMLGISMAHKHTHEREDFPLSQSAAEEKEHRFVS